MLSALTEARILTPDEEIAGGAVLIEDGVIRAVGARLPLPPAARQTRLPGLTLVPGFIDLHVHGGGGFSLAARDPQQLRGYARWAVTRGVTSFLATVCADTPDAALGCLAATADAAGPLPDGAGCLGFNLEGPFVNPARRGALPPTWPAPVDLPLFEALAEAARGRLRLMTLAPELPGADVLLRAALAHGVVVALGHTDADFQQALAAFRAGASHLTHAFNAAPPFHHRQPGPVGAALASPRVTVEVIADGVHLHPAVVELLVRALGGRVALVTDGVTPAGLREGDALLGAARARLQGDRVTLPDGTLAGSAATMDQVVRNVVRWGVADAAGAARMAAAVPAALLGLRGRKGRVEPGHDADLVALDGELEVVMTWVGGELLYLWPKGWQG